MKRLFALCAAALVLGLNACEQHKASELPPEFRERGEHHEKAPAVSAEKPAAAAH